MAEQVIEGVKRAEEEARCLLLDTPLEPQLQLERMNQREAARIEDFTEGMIAFRNKRRLEFHGR